MQEATKKELWQVKTMVRQALIRYPDTRNNDDLLYFQVCKLWAWHIGVEINTLHFATVFLGNPLEFPSYKSVERLRRIVQRQEPELQARKATKAGRKLKEADYVEYARKERTR